MKKRTHPVAIDTFLARLNFEGLFGWTRAINSRNLKPLR